MLIFLTLLTPRFFEATDRFLQNCGLLPWQLYAELWALAVATVCRIFAAKTFQFRNFVTDVDTDFGYLPRSLDFRPE